MYPFLGFDECIFEFFFFKLMIDRNALNTDCVVIGHISLRFFCFLILQDAFLPPLSHSKWENDSQSRALGLLLLHNSSSSLCLFKLHRLNVNIGLYIWRKQERNMKKNYVCRKITGGMTEKIVERKLIWFSGYPFYLSSGLYLIVLLWMLYVLSVSHSLFFFFFSFFSQSLMPVNWLAKVLL